MEATEKNRAIVEAGLNKRKAARQAKEQAHEDMQRAMFDTISLNHAAAWDKREREEADQRQKAALIKAQEAKEAARAAIYILKQERNKSLRMSYGALLVGAIASILLALDGIKIWVALLVFAACFCVMVWALVREIKLIPAMEAAEGRRVNKNE